MSESISKVAPYDPADPYKVLNPAGAPHVIGIHDNVGPVPSYDSLGLEAPAEDEGMSRKKKAAAAVLLATGGMKPPEPPAKSKRVEEPKEPKEEPKKKKFFNF